MEPIKYEFIKRKVFYKDDWMFGFYAGHDWVKPKLEDFDMKKFLEQVKYMKKGWNRDYLDKENLSDEEYLANWSVTDDIPKPTHNPLFNNEEKFRVYWGKDSKTGVKTYKYSPTIIAVAWDGIRWKYHFKEIGHQYPETKEEHLEKI